MTELVLNPYRAPSSRLVESAPITDEELLAFAQVGGAYYLRSWRGFRDCGGLWSRPHVPAFFAGVFWCFYRRMYVLGLGILPAAALVGYLAQRLLRAEPWVELVCLLAPPLLLSLFANYLYYLHAVHAIEGIRVSTRDPVAQLDAIRRAGGTHESWLSGAMYASLAFLAASLLHLAWVWLANA